MVRLVKPQENVIQSRSGISLGAAQAPGLAQAQAGAAVERLGAQYFEEAKQANQTIEYSNAMTKATEEYTKASRDRMSRAVDENGNPNYQSLVSDVANIGADVRNKIGSTIIDPDVRRRFDLEFNKFDSNQQLQAFSAARKHQIEFGRASLYNSMNTRENAALAVNPQQLGFYEDQNRKELASALASGLISPVEHARMAESFRTKVRVGSWRNLVDGAAAPSSTETDPYGSSVERLQKLQTELASDESGATGLNTEERNKLIEYTDAKIRSVKKQEELARAEHNKVLKQQVELNMLRAKGAIDEGTMDDAQLLAMKESLGAAPHEQEMNYEKLRQRLVSKQTRVLKTDNTISDMTDAVARGQDLEASYSNSQLNDLYRDTVKNLTDPQSGEQPDLMTVSKAVSQHKASYKPLMDRYSNVARFGKGEQLFEAVRAFEALRTENPQAINKMNNDDQAFLIAMENRLETTDTDPDVIVQTLRDQIYNRKEPIINARLKEFNKNKKFSEDKLASTIKNTFDTNRFLGFIDLPGGEPELSSGVVQQVQSLVRDGYVRTGNEDDAMKYAEHQLRTKAAVTQINGANSLMFNPPELMFPDLQSVELEAALHEDLAAVMGPEFDPSTVEIASFSGTRGIIDKKTNREVVSYMMFTRGPFGEEQILLQPNGAPMLWEVDADAIRSKLTLKELDARINEIQQKKETYRKNREQLQTPASPLDTTKTIR